MREKVILICEECLSRNYQTSKVKDSTKPRLSRKKYCPTCNRVTVHKESK